MQVILKLARRLILEGLTLPEKSIVDDWMPDIGSHPLHMNDKHRHIGHMHTDHAFLGSDPHRVSIPVGAGSSDSPVKAKIDAHLGSFGYKIKDYKKGLASKDNGRDIKIGKLLNKGDTRHEELQKSFGSDPARADQGINNSDHHVVISRHPHDVAGMSSCDRPWRSCLNFKDGIERHHLYHDVKEGTMVAYLAHKDDKIAKNPLGRVAIRPHISEEGHRIYRAEGVTNVFGKGAGGGLHQAAHDWATKKFPARDGQFYRRATDTYVEYPGPETKHVMGKMDPAKMDSDAISKYIYRSKKDGMPPKHFDHIMQHGSYDNKTELATIHAGKEHLGQVAEHMPEQLLHTPVFNSRTKHNFTDPDTGKPASSSGHEILRRDLAHHAEAAIPGLGKHIKKAAASSSTHVHNNMLAISKANPEGIVAQHNDTLHKSVINKPVHGLGTAEKHKSAGDAIANASLVALSASKPTFDHLMGKLSRGVESYKPGRAKSNWVHHALDALKDGGHPARHETRLMANNLRKNPHYDSSKHDSVISKLGGK